MAYVITSACAGTRDGACSEICPMDCIADAGKQFVINPNECIDCGACVPACPVEAIYPDSDVPEGEEASIELNRTFFAQ